MTISFARDGATFSIVDNESLNLHDALPPGVYVVRFAPARGYYLQLADNFSMPKKMYGSTIKQADRIINTYKTRTTNTGVLLTGQKGSGKSLLAKVVAHQLQQEGGVTLLLNEPHTGDAFNAFLQGITQPCVVLFDEYEKVYDDEQQQALLSTLDGMFPSKKLFILTANNRHRVNEFMLNRPGRLFYLLEFSGLDAAFIREYSQDNLINKEHVESVVLAAAVFGDFCFDMLQALVEEMNRYNEPAHESIRMLNMSPTYGASSRRYDVEFYFNGEPLVASGYDEDNLRTPTALNDGYSITAYGWDEDHEDRPVNGITTPVTLHLQQRYLIRFDPDTGCIIYQGDKPGYHIIFRPIEAASWDFESYLGGTSNGAQQPTAKPRVVVPDTKAASHAQEPNRPQSRKPRPLLAANKFAKDAAKS